jgi:hypothetical protein
VTAGIRRAHRFGRPRLVHRPLRRDAFGLGGILRQGAHLQPPVALVAMVPGTCRLLFGRGTIAFLRSFCRRTRGVGARTPAPPLLALGAFGLIRILGRCSARHGVLAGNHRRLRRGIALLALPFATSRSVRAGLLSCFRRPRNSRLAAGFGVIQGSDPLRRARPGSRSRRSSCSMLPRTYQLVITSPNSFSAGAAFIPADGVVALNGQSRPARSGPRRCSLRD